MTTPEIAKWKSVEVYGTEFNKHLKTMADTIDNLKLWDWLRQESPPNEKGYMWWGHENVIRISNNLPDNPHSGATFAFALRQMQSIAKNGFSKWNSQDDVPS